MQSHSDLRPITIAIGDKTGTASGHSARYPAKTTTWPKMVHVLSRAIDTGETVAEYAAMDKAAKGRIKNVGGFVGGSFRGGKRSSLNVEYRSIITLDIDEASLGAWEAFKALYGFAAVVYSTHSHTPERPKLRIVMPLDRDVTALEYEAVSRRVAEWFGIDMMDITTYEPHRLMYWPSKSTDAEFFFDECAGSWLRVDEVLATYTDWTDAREYPVGEREKARVLKHMGSKAADPTQRPLGSAVGCFCRLYSITEAIDHFLSDVYERGDDQGRDLRYSYKEGSMRNGLIIYGDERGVAGDLFATSHHDTDPVKAHSSGSVNAFDLVRIHLYADLDKDAKPDTPAHRQKSYQAMEKLMLDNPDCKLALMRERKAAKAAQVHEDFGYGVDGDDDMDNEEGSMLRRGLMAGGGDEWTVQLDTDHKGNVRSTINNAELFLENDERFKGLLGYNQLALRLELRRIPLWECEAGKKWKARAWTDGDEAVLRKLLEKEGISTKEHVIAAVKNAEVLHKFHPVREYFTGLEWDGIKRVDTLFMDFLGAEDSPYVRAVTRKMMLAAVARILCPGIKFDNALVLVGPQGRGKSTMLARLFRSGGDEGTWCSTRWFSDSFNFTMLKDPLKAAEQMRGRWGIEFGEMVGMSRELENETKSFLSSQYDNPRFSYAQYNTEMPRQCVFFGTTNKQDFLRGNEGNRRFWPVVIDREDRAADVWADLDEHYVDQVWAEMLAAWGEGESLMLDSEIEAAALAIQSGHAEVNVMQSSIEGYVSALLPVGWQGWSKGQRVGHFANAIGVVGDDLQAQGTVQRERVSFQEWWQEGMGAGTSGKVPTNRDREVFRGCMKMIGWDELEVSRAHWIDKVYGVQRCVFVRPMDSGGDAGGGPGSSDFLLQ